MKFIIIATIILDIILYLISNYNSKRTSNKDLSKLNLFYFTNINILEYKYFYIKKIINKILF
jgi:hypothetical protein